MTSSENETELTDTVGQYFEGIIDGISPSNLARAEQMRFLVESKLYFAFFIHIYIKRKSLFKTRTLLANQAIYFSCSGHNVFLDSLGNGKRSNEVHTGKSPTGPIAARFVHSLHPERLLASPPRAHGT